MKALGFVLLHAGCFGTEHGWHWFFPFFFFFMFLIFVFSARRGRYNSCRWPWGYKHYESPKTGAKDILKTRYANGEIDKEEFDRMMEDMSQETDL